MVFFYHAFPTTVLSVVIVWGLISIAPWVYHAGGAISVDPSGPALTVTLLWSVILSFLGSVHCYYAHAQPMRALILEREYHGVYPGQPAVAFPDAAYIEFAGSARVDTSQGVSYSSLNSGLSTFCVAPVVSPATTGRTSFWAIGVDCCGEKGDKFECDDVANLGVKTGWVLPHKNGDDLYDAIGKYVSPLEGRRDMFIHAVEKAEAKFGISTPGTHTIFLRWTSKSKADIISYQWIAILVTIVLFAAGLGVLSFFMTRLYQRFVNVRNYHVMKRMSGQEGQELQESEEDSMTPQIDELLIQAQMQAGGSDASGSIDRIRKIIHRDNLERFRPELSAADMCIMGVTLPYIALMLSAILWTFGRCSNLGYLIMTPIFSILFIFILALLATPNRAVTGWFLLMATIAGCYIGDVNYRNNTFHYCSSVGRRAYEHVPADASTADYWDGGRLNFDKSTILSTNHSTGFVHAGDTYCVAPVISKDAPCKDDGSPPPSLAETFEVEMPSFLQVNDTAARLWQDEKVEAANLLPPPTFLQRHHRRHGHRAAASAQRNEMALAHRVDSGIAQVVCANPAPARVEFWAIGLNCCDARRKFWCDGAAVKDARAAVVVRAHADEASNDLKVDSAVHGHSKPGLGKVKLKSLVKSERQYFYAAIDQAVAAYSLPLPDRPVLLHWGENAESLQANWKKRATGVLVMTAIASLLLILFIGITSFCFMKQQRKREEKEEKDYESRVTGQPAEATVYDSPRPSLGPANSGALGFAPPRGGMSMSRRGSVT